MLREKYLPLFRHLRLLALIVTRQSAICHSLPDTATSFVDTFLGRALCEKRGRRHEMGHGAVSLGADAVRPQPEGVRLGDRHADGGSTSGPRPGRL